MPDATVPSAAAGPVVTTERDGAVATVRLDRPAAMNALTSEAKEALLAALRDVAADPAVRAVVLTGSGRAFCVGQDLKEHVAALRAAQADPAKAEGLGATVREHYNPIATLLATMPKPVVAAVNGVAAGAGASFAFGCDVRLLAASAGFNLAFTGIALSADSGATWWLPRLVGPARAKELLMRPRTIPADEALALGLATEVVPDAELPARAAALAAELAAGPTLAYAAVRRMVAASSGQDLASALAQEAELMDTTGASADHLAAVEAFVAKRRPVFEGR